MFAASGDRHLRKMYCAMCAHAVYYGPDAIKSLSLYPGSHVGLSWLYPIAGPKIASMVSRQSGQVGQDCVLSCRSDNLCFWPMLAYQCGSECDETAVTTNPKGNVVSVQNLINRPVQIALSWFTYSGILYVVFFMLFVTLLVAVIV